MKRNSLLLGMALAATSLFAQPAAGDISSFLELKGDLGFDLTFTGEPGVRGCVGDFNNDGVDDFILTGLHKVGEKTELNDEGETITVDVLQSFFRVYLGQRNGVPALAYEDDDFGIGGNGSVDCEKLSDGSWLIAVQGGSDGNWSNPFKAYIYTLSVNGTDVVMEENVDLDYGSGRGSIRLLDIDMDGNLDVFQHSWLASGTWTAYSSVYLNADNTNSMFDLDRDQHGIRPAVNTFAVKGDLNGDGKIDILLPVQGTGLFAYFNNGDDTFEEVLVTAFSKDDREDDINVRNEEDGTQAELIDVDGDGIPEIVMAGTNDNTGGEWEFFLKIYKYNASTNSYSEIPSTDKAGNTVFWTGGQRGDFAIGDFDGDGNLDIIFGGEAKLNDTWKTVTLFCSGNGKGGFDQIDCTMPDEGGAGIPAMCRRAQFGQFLVGDFNGDGNPDLVQAGTTYYAKLGGVRYYQNLNEPNSIADNKIGAISMYTTGKQLIVNGAENARYNIIDLSGVKCATGICNNGQSITLNLNTGIYIVEVETELGATTQKIVVR